MVQKWKKFINKNPLKQDLELIIQDIQNENIDKYYVKPLKWHANTFRIRKWKIRIIFEQNSKWNTIVAVDTRWSIYRGL